MNSVDDMSSPLGSLSRRLPSAKCKNGCAFYGNPAWQGLCSVCHRELASGGSPGRPAQPVTGKLIDFDEDASAETCAMDVFVAARASQDAMQARVSQRPASSPARMTPKPSTNGTASTPPSQPSPRKALVETYAPPPVRPQPSQPPPRTTIASTAATLAPSAPTPPLTASQKLFSMFLGKKSGTVAAQMSASSSVATSTPPTTATTAPSSSSSTTTTTTTTSSVNSSGGNTTAAAATAAAVAGMGTKKKKSSSFADFLALMRLPAAQGLVELTCTFIDRFTALAEKRRSTVEEQSEQVLTFLQDMAGRMARHVLWRDAEERSLERSVDALEKYVTAKIYNYVFTAKGTDDAHKDAVLLAKMTSCQWIKLHHLGTDSINVGCADELILSAIRELRKMDDKLAPQDKLACIVRCSKLVFDILQRTRDSSGSSAGGGGGNAAGADEFLPVLIYITIKANLRTLQSNLQFISRFCNPSKLMSGEGGYYFTNMCCAASFIETLSAKSLEMDPGEFEMRVTGRDAAVQALDGQDGPSATAVLPDGPIADAWREDAAAVRVLHAKQADLADRMAKLETTLSQERDGLRQPLTLGADPWEMAQVAKRAVSAPPAKPTTLPSVPVVDDLIQLFPETDAEEKGTPAADATLRREEEDIKIALALSMSEQ